MKSVLFVDDEANVLHGLQRMLRSVRHAWRVETASSGPAALERLEREPFDVVVSDMKMPGMGGAELLRRVKTRHPDTVRIVLSGQAERAAILESLAPSHRYLAKPCDAEALRRVLEDVQSLRDLLGASARRAAAAVDFLPGARATCLALGRELDGPAPRPARVVELIGADPGLAANVLKLVNSAYFGVSEPTADAARALAAFDPETLRELRAAAVFEPACGGDDGDDPSDRVAREARRLSAAARRAAEGQGASGAAVALAGQAGMLFGVGCLVPHSESGANAPAAAASGAYLLGLWGLPEALVDALAYHARPDECPRPSPVLRALHAALQPEYAVAGQV